MAPAYFPWRTTRALPQALGMPNARGDIPSAIADAEGWYRHGDAWARDCWLPLRDGRRDETGNVKVRFTVGPPVSRGLDRIRTIRVLFIHVIPYPLR